MILNCSFWKAIKKPYDEDDFLSRFAEIELRCNLAADHVPGCGGLRKSCDKPAAPCPVAVMQGPDCFCRQMREMAYSCHGDLDFCELDEVEQKKLAMACRQS